MEFIIINMNSITKKDIKSITKDINLITKKDINSITKDINLITKKRYKINSKRLF